MLVLDGVTAGYGGVTVLRHVTVRVPPGAVVALLGPNGAGKTTLLRVASGLVRPSSGGLTVDGRDLTGRPPHELREHGVGHVPEGRGVFATLTVRENLAVQALGGEVAEAVDRAVSAFPILGQRLDQQAGTMSGGEQQMLALARTYVQRPRYVLLDEVSMGLAPKIIDEIFEFLRLLSAEGCSLLLVEQYISRALEVADFVYVLNKGAVGFVGEPCELDGDDIFAQYVGGSRS